MCFAGLWAVLMTLLHGYNWHNVGISVPLAAFPGSQRQLLPKAVFTQDGCWILTNSRQLNSCVLCVEMKVYGVLNSVTDGLDIITSIEVSALTADPVDSWMMTAAALRQLFCSYRSMTVVLMASYMHMMNEISSDSELSAFFYISHWSYVLLVFHL